ncbi:MAG: hypothetical protein ACWGSQ_07065 [Longimicrobiales bacterium]
MEDPVKRDFRTWCAAVSGPVFSAGKGESWSEPRELPLAPTGYRQ